MQPRYRIAWDLTGWAVIDTASDQIAELDGLLLIGLQPEEAEDISNTLNETMASAMIRSGQFSNDSEFTFDLSFVRMIE